jgi:hypothetical protein
LQDNAQNTVHLEINYTVTVAACEQACVNCSRTLADKNQLGPAQPHGPGWAQPKKGSFKKYVIFCKYFIAF